MKSVNKNNLNSSARHSSSNEANKNGMNFNILNHDIDENSFELDMDSGEDEIDVGTHGDSLLINYNNINSSDSYSSFPNNISTSQVSAQQSVPSVHNLNNELQHFNQLISPNQLNNNQLEQNRNNFVVPQNTAVMSEADRKRAHHNALERKRRDHIKDSFHTLRDAIPNIKGEKVSTSRAQILKAATDYIKTMKNRNTLYQNDIDLIKKQNMEIESQIRQLEKSKLNLNSNIVMKTEQIEQTHHLQLNDINSDDNDFKFELTESLNQQGNTNSLNNNNNVLKTNNVLILTKPNGPSGQTTSKKFKTIVNTKNNNIMKNGNFL